MLQIRPIAQPEGWILITEISLKRVCTCALAMNVTDDASIGMILCLARYVKCESSRHMRGNNKMCDFALLPEIVSGTSYEKLARDLGAT